MADQVALGLGDLVGWDRLGDHAAQLVGNHLDRERGAVDVDAGLHGEGARVAIARVAAKHVVRKTTPLADLGKEARRHATADDGLPDSHRVAIFVCCAQSIDAQHDVGLVTLTLLDGHDRLGNRGHDRLWQLWRRFGGESTKALAHLGYEALGDAATQSNRDALGLVPRAQVVGKRLARRGPHRLLGADDRAADWRVAIARRVVDLAHDVARRIRVHVDLFDDHALLALELFGIELRVEKHVGQDVERSRCVGGRALDVVRGHLLARKSVELATDAVDLGRDVACRWAALRTLKQHVLGEVGDACRRGLLAARAGGDGDDDGDAGGVAHRGAEDAGAVGKSL